VKRYDKDQFVPVGGSIGNGSYGQVRKVVHKRTAELFAMKEIPKKKVSDHKMEEYLFREVKLQYKMRHPNILRLHYYFEDAEMVYLLLEYASGGSLFGHLRKKGRLPEHEAAPIFIGVAKALNFMHSHSIVHRDLKPENILMCAGGVAKIADFGWSAEMKDGAPRHTFCGTWDYLSPEMVQNEPHDHTVDTWAVGVLLYEMLTGRPPFAASNQMKALSRITNVDLQVPETVSLLARDLIVKILVRDRKKRLTLEEGIRHEWARCFLSLNEGDASSTSPSRPQSVLPGSGPAAVTSPDSRTALQTQPPALAACDGISSAGFEPQARSLEPTVKAAYDGVSSAGFEPQVRSLEPTVKAAHDGVSSTGFEPQVRTLEPTAQALAVERLMPKAKALASSANTAAGFKEAPTSGTGTGASGAELGIRQKLQAMRRDLADDLPDISPVANGSAAGRSQVSGSAGKGSGHEASNPRDEARAMLPSETAQLLQDLRGGKSSAAARHVPAKVQSPEPSPRGTRTSGNCIPSPRDLLPKELALQAGGLDSEVTAPTASSASQGASYAETDTYKSIAAWVQKSVRKSPSTRRASEPLAEELDRTVPAPKSASSGDPEDESTFSRRAARRATAPDILAHPVAEKREISPIARSVWQ
jgi:aurora kinase